MTVLYPSIRGSGVEVYTERLVAGLAPLGWKGQLIRFSPAWEYFPWGLRFAWNKEVPLTRECDLVHVNADYGCYFAVAGKPLVATVLAVLFVFPAIAFLFVLDQRGLLPEESVSGPAAATDSVAE